MITFKEKYLSTLEDQVKDTFHKFFNSIAFMKRQNILFLHHTTKMGGAEFSLVSLLYELSQKGHKINLVLPNKGPLYHAVSPEVGKVIAPIVRLKRSTKIEKKIYYIFSILQTLLVLTKHFWNDKPEIIHANCTTAHLFAIPIAFLWRKPLIWHVRDTLPPKLPVWFLLWRATRVIVVSHHLTTQHHLFSDSKKITVLHNPLMKTPTKITKHGANIREQLGLPPQSILVAQIGQLQPQKRIEDFITVAGHVAKKIDNLYFLIIGSDLFDEFSTYKKQLKHQINSQGLEAHFHWLGHIPELDEIFPEIDLLFHPSPNEPFGRVIIEAWSHAVPIIAINRAGPAEIITHKKNGMLVEPYHITEMAEAMVYLLSQSQVRKEMGIQGKKTVLELFQPEPYAEHLENLYLSLTQGTASKTHLA